MRKRVAGAAILVAIGVGIWLSNLFKGLGPGGDGTEVARHPQTLSSVESSEVAGSGESELARDAGGRISPEIPTVVIDERQFYMEKSGGDATKLIPTDATANTELIPTDVTHIVTLVEQAEPNADGIRLQIKRRRSSRPSAETALDEALHKAGVTEDQILRHRGFVD